MQTKANWPIRVGGEYLVLKREPLKFRVTEIDGDRIHFFHVHPDVSGGKPFGPSDWSANCFRENTAPEDQSPLPALIEALTAMRSFMWSEGYADQNEAMAKADAALAKVTASEPVPEEVAA